MENREEVKTGGSFVKM